MHGSLDDGSLSVLGAVRQPLVAAISSPRGALPELRMTRTALTDGAALQTSGPTATLPPPRRRRRDGQPERRGRRIGPAHLQYRLARGALGRVLSGTTVAGARVLCSSTRARERSQLVTASASGAFAVTLHDPFAGDASQCRRVSRRRMA